MQERLQRLQSDIWELDADIEYTYSLIGNYYGEIDMLEGRMKQLKAELESKKKQLVAAMKEKKLVDHSGVAGTKKGFKSGLYRSSWGNTFLIKKTSEGGIQSRAWQGTSEHSPREKGKWYNVGEMKYEDNETLHWEMTDQDGFCCGNITEGYLKIIDEQTMQVTKWRAYPKDQPKPADKVGWVDEPRLDFWK
jgi:hypothetical protein